MAWAMRPVVTDKDKLSPDFVLADNESAPKIAEAMDIEIEDE
jgi:hypothetical protein